MTRAEHLAWCKDRALEYLPGNPREACQSMLSDLTKHPETARNASMGFGLMLAMGASDSPEAARKFIEGFR